MVEAYWEIDLLPLNQDGVPDKQFNAKYVQSFVVGALEGVQVPEGPNWDHYQYLNSLQSRWWESLQDWQTLLYWFEFLKKKLLSKESEMINKIISVLREEKQRIYQLKSLSVF